MDAPVTVCGIGVGLLGGAGATCAGRRRHPVGPAGHGVVPGGVHGVVPAASGGERVVGGGGACGTGTAGSELAYTGSTLTAAVLGAGRSGAGLGLMVLGRRRAAGLG